MKTLLSVLLIALSLNTVMAQDCSNPDRKVKREARKRARGLVKKQGYRPDLTIGTAKSMLRKVICYEQTLYTESKEPEERFIIEAIASRGKSQNLATKKARNDARNEIGKNMGNYLAGLVEKDGYFVNGDNEDISNEIEESYSAFNEIFAAELKRNKVLARFFRTEDNGYIKCLVIIAMDKQQFKEDVKKLKKKEIQNRLKSVRHKLEKQLYE